MLLVPLLVIIPIEVLGVEAGVGGYLPGTGYGPKAGVFYSHEVFGDIRISSGLSYWTKKRVFEHALTVRDCVFSDLSFHQDGVLTVDLSERFLVGMGGGLSLHILKNYAKETTDYGNLLVTDYRTETLNRLGLRAILLAEVKIREISLGVRTAYDALLMQTEGKNLFYEQGDIRVLSVALVVSGDWW